MNKEEISCVSCEAEFYIESDQIAYFCPHCGSDLFLDEDLDDLQAMDEEELDEDY
jgi:Zn finger protein HypA/HybF involved in hydrogenase expression